MLAQWPDEALEAAPLDAYTAICLLTHDPKIDDRALVRALQAECFYIGALGSRKTHARRLERMKAEGFDDAALARIHAPIGLDIGAVSPCGNRRLHRRRNHRRAAQEAAALGKACSVKFGPVPVAEARGAITAHAVRLGELALQEGPCDRRRGSGGAASRQASRA